MAPSCKAYYPDFWILNTKPIGGPQIIGPPIDHMPDFCYNPFTDFIHSGFHSDKTERSGGLP